MQLNNNIVLLEAVNFEAVHVEEEIKIYVRSSLIRQNVQLLSALGERRWLEWRLEFRDGRWTKVPYMPSGWRASSTDASTWSTLDEVLAVESQFNGIGISFNDKPAILIDIDHCVENGQIVHKDREKILELINRADTYVEISPSGTGLHIIIFLTASVELIKNREAPYEIYTKGRYFTVTGIPFGEIKAPRTITPEEALSLISIIGYPWKRESQPQNLGNEYPKAVTSLSNEVLLQKMFDSPKGAKIKALYNGDVSEFGGDDSRADASLCWNLAYWTGKDASRIESLWLESLLGSREKTQKTKDYRQRTIKFAIEHQPESYNPSSSDYSQDSAPYLEFISDIDLLATDMPTIDWLIEGLLVKNTLNMLSAPSGNGKSFVALDMALSLAHGLLLFGHFKTVKTNVLIVSEEDGFALLKHRYQMLLQAGEDPGGVSFVVQSGRKISEAWVNEIIKFTKANNIQFVILDSLRALHTKKEDSSDEMQVIMDELFKLIRSGLTVLFLHHHIKGHNGKNNKSDDDVDLARGSSGINAAVYGHLTCQEKKKGGHYFIISQVKLKELAIKPFVVSISSRLQPEHVSFDYAGNYDPNITAGDTMEDNLMRHFREHKEEYFIRKNFVELKFAKNAEDKTLRSALKTLVSEKKIEEKKYADLSKEDRELMPDKNPKKNTVVYKFIAD